MDEEFSLLLHNILQFATAYAVQYPNIHMSWILYPRTPEEAYHTKLHQLQNRLCKFVYLLARSPSHPLPYVGKSLQVVPTLLRILHKFLHSVWSSFELAQG